MSLENLVNAIKNSTNSSEDPSMWIYKEEVLIPLDRFLMDKCPGYKHYEFCLSREKTVKELLFLINSGGTIGLSRRKLNKYMDNLVSNAYLAPIQIYNVIDNAADYLYGLLGDYRCYQAISMLQDALEPEYKKLMTFDRDMDRSLNSSRKKRHTAIAEISAVNNLGRDIGTNIAKFTQRLTDQEAAKIISRDTSTARRGRKPSGVKPITSTVSGGYRKSRKGRKSRKSRKGRKSRKQQLMN